MGFTDLRMGLVMKTFVEIRNYYSALESTLITIRIMERGLCPNTLRWIPTGHNTSLIEKKLMQESYATPSACD